MQVNIVETGHTEIQAIRNTQRAFFRAGNTRELDFRMEQIKNLRKALVEREDEIAEALYQDFRKSRFEVFATEVAFTLEEIDYVLDNLEDWTKPEKVKASLITFPSNEYIYYEPYGVSLIMAPWNYPLQLVLSPLVGAMAAGNCAVLKPSELAPNTAALIAEMVASTFDPGYITVVQGGVDTARALLEEQWDYIFFTGSVQVGKIVMQAAAKHLTPVTLELGGKSPCIVDETADLEYAARRIVWGKYLNGGQTCIAPDYLLVHEDVKEEMVRLLGKTLRDFYGEEPQTSPDFPRIIHQKHFERLCQFLEDGKAVIGGKSDAEELYLAPTVLDEVEWESPVMQEEIFGPILPVLTFTDLSQAIERVNDRPKPLALYFFSSRSRRQEQVLKETSSGGACINDTLSHIVNPKLPFGGVGESGMGHYQGRASFDTFSNHKSVTKRSTWLEHPLLYPPYNGKLPWLKRLLKWI